MDAPILVTGAHRSGTTWVGRMLCAGGDAFYIHEPFNAGTVGPAWQEQVPYWYFYLNPENEEEYERSLQRVIDIRYPTLDGFRKARNLRHFLRLGRDSVFALNARFRHKRPLLKDPLALFSAEWIAERFNMQVIVMIRHPLAFASSLKRLDWQFDFAHWVQQQELIDNLLSSFRDEINEYASNRNRDVIDQAILMWNAIYSAVHQYQRAHPGWLFVIHEQLAEVPLEGFEKLYRYCGLDWNRKAKNAVMAHSQEGNVKEVPLATQSDTA